VAQAFAQCHSVFQLLTGRLDVGQAILPADGFQPAPAALSQARTAGRKATAARTWLPHIGKLSGIRLRPGNRRLGHDRRHCFLQALDLLQQLLDWLVLGQSLQSIDRFRAKEVGAPWIVDVFLVVQLRLVVK